MRPSASIKSGFFEDHCMDCHDEGTHKGGFVLENLPFQPAERKNALAWEVVFDKLERGRDASEKSSAARARGARRGGKGTRGGARRRLRAAAAKDRGGFLCGA